MSRVAYLIGISGTGKTALSEPLAREIKAHYIEFDHLRDKILRRLFPNGKPSGDAWSNWDHALNADGSACALTKVIAEELPSFSNDAALLADGFDFGHVGVRVAFRNALATCGIGAVEERVFWFDPPAAVVHANRMQRKRPSQVNETLADVKQHRDYYVQRIDHDRICRFETPDALIRDLRTFLLGE